MKLTKDDPKLTAYALGELSPRESYEVEKALESQPELQSEVEDILAFEALFGEKDKLSPRQRAAIFQFGGEAGNVVHIPQRSWRTGVVAILAAAAAVVITLTMLQSPAPKTASSVATVDWSSWTDAEMLNRVGVNNEAWNTKEVSGVQKLAKSTQALKVHAASFRQEMKSRAVQSTEREITDGNVDSKRWKTRSTAPVSRVPLVAGGASFEWISKHINKGELPQAGSVRVEELLNVSVPQLQPDLIVGGVAGSVEFVQSPWSSGELLAFVRISATNGALTQAGVKFSESVNSYRLLGYSESQASIAPAEQQMNHSHIAVYEMQLDGALNDAVKILSLELQVRDGDQLESDELHVFYNAPSWENLVHRDLQYSVLVATWAQWLQDPKSARLKSKVQEQARVVTASNAKQLQMLTAIQKSLEL